MIIDQLPTISDVQNSDELPIERGQTTYKTTFSKVVDAAAKIVADEYDNTSTYAVGDYCVYEGTLYVCNTDISTAEEWNASHWTATNVTDITRASAAALATYVRPNLLDNWYFVGGGSQPGVFPINQRGQASYSNANAYTIDRWKLISGALTVASGGITLNGTIVQILPASIGLPVVASALLSDGSMITPSYDDNTKTFTLTATGQTIVAVKLELGSVQTLAHQENGAWVLNEIPDYGQELARCQRYFEADLFSITTWPVANTFDIMIPYKVTKARTPTFTGSIFYYSSSGWESVPAQIEAPPESPLFGVRAYSPSNTAPANSIYRVTITASAEL